MTSDPLLLPADAFAAEIPGFTVDGAGKPVIGLDPQDLFAFGHLIRLTEELLLDLFSRGLLSGTTHTCIGQEICQISVVRALSDPDDVVLSNHRNHGHFLTYSGDFLGLLGEVLGREVGVCRGFGGSQHLAFRGFHSNGVQGGMTAIGTGLALDRKLRESAGVVTIIVGDGTLGEGLLYESMNLAAIWETATLFVVEHNGIAQTTSTRDTLAGTIEGRGAAFGLRTWRFDDSDPDFAAAVDGVVTEIRNGGGPGLLIIDTGRLGPHSKGDDLRSDEDKKSMAARDALGRLARRLSPTVRGAIEARNGAFVDELEAAALASPEARFAAQPGHILRPVRRERIPRRPVRAGNVREALNAALRCLLGNLDELILLGEDLHQPYGGAFKVSAGLSSVFPRRVISTPISEAGITGAGIGLALSGRPTIVEVMFADFLTLCMDQVYNHAVKFPGLFSECDVPLVIRAPCGGRRGYGPTHSQSLENLFVSVPSLTVVYGSHRHNCGQLLVDAASRWANPVLFLEHKLLYGERQSPEGYEILPHGDDPGAALFPTLRAGSEEPDVTLVSFGGMLPYVERAAARLQADEELSVEIVTPSLLSPLPRTTLTNALLSRPRIAVVEESHHEFGVSAEVVACLAEAQYGGRVVRLGMPPVPIASARSLEEAQLVDERAIVRKILELF